MKKYFYQIGLFVVILFIVNQLLFNLGNDLYYKNYDKYSLNFNNYLFSDSHGTPLGKQTQHYNIYNFSIGSDSYIDIKRKINFLREKTKLDTIYLSADEHMLSPYREQLNNLDKSSYYTTENDFSTQFEYYKSEISQKIIYFQPKTGAVLRKYFLSKLDNLFTSNQAEEVKTDLNWNDMSMEAKDKRISKRIATQFNSPESSKLLEETLLNIINICKTNNIIIIGVKFPVTKAYYKHTKDKSYGVESIFRENNLTVLDFQSSYIDNDNMFYNEDHLTTKGGKIFNNLLFKSQLKISND